MATAELWDMTTGIMTTHIPTDSEALLQLVQWLSPAFPLGSFAYSHGLEYAITHGDIADSQGLGTWLRTVLLHGSGRCDAALLAQVLQGADPVEVDCLARALAAGPERLIESVTQGRAFLATTNALLHTDADDLTLPVAVGLQARSLGLPTETVIALYLQGFASNLVLGAVRLIPLGQTEGQGVLHALGPLIADLARELAQGGEDLLWSASFGADLAAMAHEYQEVRLFRS